MAYLVRVTKEAEAAVAELLARKLVKEGAEAVGA